MTYKRFLAMIATSTVVMFILMYSTAYRFTHVWWSQTRFWMALYMGAAMAVIMMGFMLSMYSDKQKNVAIFAGSAVLFMLALFLARSQKTIGDVAWMKAMIPHHSIAILTSERAQISDPRVRRLADEIILAQRREIAEMEALIADLDGTSATVRRSNPPSRPSTAAPRI
jgi:Kef-type K+ transport system membrane component KefB